MKPFNIYISQVRGKTLALIGISSFLSLFFASMIERYAIDIHLWHIIALVLGLLSVILILSRPYYGFLLIVGLIPLPSVSSYEIAGVDIILWIAALTFFRFTVGKLITNKPKFILNAPTVILGLFVCIVFLSFCYAADTKLVCESVSPFVMMFFLYFCATHMISSKRQLLQTFSVIIAGISFAVVVALLQLFFNWEINPLTGKLMDIIVFTEDKYYFMPQGTFYVFWDLTLNIVFLFPLMLSLYCIDHSCLRKFFIAAIIVGSIFLVLYGAQRVQILGLILIAGLFFIRSRRKIITASVIFVLISVFVAIATPEQTWTRMRSALTPSQDASFLERTGIYKAGISMFLDKPFLGVGLSHFNDSIPSYGFYKKQGAHSTALKTLGEHGIFAFLLFYGLLLYIFKSLNNLLKKFRHNGNKDYEAIAKSVRISLIVFFFMSFFLEFLAQNKYLGVLLGIAVALRHLKTLEPMKILNFSNRSHIKKSC